VNLGYDAVLPSLPGAIAVRLLAACSLAAPGASPSAARLTLPEALVEAQAHNPTLAAARLRTAIDRAAVAQAGERPNPELRFEAERETPKQSLTLAQPIELGKRGRRVAVARAAARGGEVEIARVEAETRIAVTRSYDALAAAQRRTQLGAELRQIAERARTATQARFEAGDVARLDVLQADLAAYDAENEAAALSGDEAAARAELNAQLGRPAETMTTVVEEVPDDAAPLANEADLEAALARNIGVQALDRAVEEAEARVSLARAEQVPDPTLEGAITRDSEPEFLYGWRAAVAVAIPLFTQHRAGVRLEEAIAAQRRAERAALQQQVRAAVEGARARVAARRQQYRRYRDEVLPRAKEVEAMAEDSYRSGQTGLGALLQSLQATREIRRRALEAALEYATARADLEQALLLAPEAGGGAGR
jgi:cobalt-zinc-cadmium efflux system outer membrane protein